MRRLEAGATPLKENEGNHHGPRDGHLKNYTGTSDTNDGDGGGGDDDNDDDGNDDGDGDD